ncbi:hypothetical protein CLIB1423_03S02828 [[Candida] railenensis]|uniref:Uncharacterized protein n=1 Tax=[Candida] railenensis TaxID=45579 RepID=A0A9P0QMI1_9ASCO|nr:hypothetical protein CLIB1423_03S02828 [[Candida] railenensis]
MDASCGPSNALTNLSKHSQRDTTLQNEASQRFNAFNKGQDFKTNSNQIDRNLNRDFEQFSGHQNQFQAQHQQYQFQPFQHSNQQQQQQFNQQQHHNVMHANQQPMQNGQAKWVSDFSQMNIGDQQQKNNWQSQFMAQPQQNIQQQRHQQSPSHLQQPMVNRYIAQTMPFNLSMRTDLSTPLTEHQEVHQAESVQESFNQQFDEIERELQSNEQVLNKQLSDRGGDDKAEFAKTARQVHSSMMSVQNEETSNKFQNSNFLKLMSSISNRSVELEGDKLVDTDTRVDIREHLADPLQHEKAEAAADRERANVEQMNLDNNVYPLTQAETAPAINVPYLRPPGITRPVQQREESQINTLPDPLAHIRDGGLDGITDPLMAAKIISGNQVKDKHWLGSNNNDDDWLDMTEDAPSRPGSILNPRDQEMYDDYRHDDDYH